MSLEMAVGAASAAHEHHHDHRRSQAHHHDHHDHHHWHDDDGFLHHGGLARSRTSFVAQEHVTKKELRKSIANIEIRADIMLDRLHLEVAMQQMVIKLPTFLLRVTCFLLALYQFSPAEDVFDIHRHIEDYFLIGQAHQTKTYDDIYVYMEKFEELNQKMQATSSAYWCEKRYAEHTWSEELMVPTWRCPSPRLYSLDLITDSSASWANVSSGGNASTDHRRLAGESSSVSTATGGIPPCEDNDTQLQIEEGSSSVTCATSAVDHHHVCEHDLGILLCPRTCGYCSPFQYSHLKRFEKPQVTMLPTMVYQTRFAQAPCHGFAQVYEDQPHNPMLVLLPALDGKRNGRVLTCINREQLQEDEYALELDCPPGSPTSHCKNNLTQITHKHTFRGQIVYPELLIEPHRDIKAMKEVEWIDLQTQSLTVSTMVYTEGVEIFTSVSIMFTMDAAGNVVVTHDLISYRDLINGSRTLFIVCMIICSVGALIGGAISAFHMFKHPEDCNWNYQGYEMFSRTALFIYPPILLIQWTQQIPMGKEYDKLLHTFLDMTDMSWLSIDNSIQSFFDVKTEIYSETSWLKRHRVVAYLVCYIQFLQLIFYFNAHPKMSILTATVAKGLDQIFHFLVIFLVLFLMLGFMAHWMIGEYLSEYGTFHRALISQAEMMFGVFVEAKGAQRLSGLMKAMYWMYATTFLLVIWMTLLNFILAIIINAFVDVKHENQEKHHVQNFLVDLFGAVVDPLLSYKNKWPSKHRLITFFDEVVEQHKQAEDAKALESATTSMTGDVVTPPACTSQVLSEKFPELASVDRVSRFLLHYYNKSEEIATKGIKDAIGLGSEGSEALRDCTQV